MDGIAIMILISSRTKLTIILPRLVSRNCFDFTFSICLISYVVIHHLLMSTDSNTDGNTPSSEDDYLQIIFCIFSYNEM